jgi:mannose-6-phosphate isomerase
MPENENQVLAPFTIPKPWGNYLEFIRNTPATVKIITVNPGEMISLQKHAKRAEFWRVLSGNGTVTVGEEQFPVVAGHEFHIARGVAHRMAAGSEPLIILEITIGESDEEDIVRLEDKYGRTMPS